MLVRLLLPAALLLLSPLSPARADDITDQINEAVTAYGKHDTATAIAGLEAALNLLRQSRADVYGKLLPAAPAGWEARETEVMAGAAALGVGTGASREYHQGDQTVKISILADSPLLQAISAFAATGMAGLPGARTSIVNGRRAIYMKDDNAYMTIAAERVLVRIEGHGGVPEPVLKQFLTAMDFAAIERAGK